MADPLLTGAARGIVRLSGSFGSFFAFAVKGVGLLSISFGKALLSMALGAGKALSGIAATGAGSMAVNTLRVVAPHVALVAGSVALTQAIRNTPAYKDMTDQEKAAREASGGFLSYLWGAAGRGIQDASSAPTQLLQWLPIPDFLKPGADNQAAQPTGMVGALLQALGLAKSVGGPAVDTPATPGGEYRPGSSQHDAVDDEPRWRGDTAEGAVYTAPGSVDGMASQGTGDTGAGTGFDTAPGPVVMADNEQKSLLATADRGPTDQHGRATNERWPACRVDRYDTASNEEQATAPPWRLDYDLNLDELVRGLMANIELVDSGMRIDGSLIVCSVDIESGRGGARYDKQVSEGRFGPCLRTATVPVTAWLRAHRC